VGLLVLVLIAAGGYALWRGWQEQAGEVTPVADPAPTDVPALPEGNPIVTFACDSADLAHFQDLAREFEATQSEVAVQVVSFDEILEAGDSDLPPGEAALRVLSAADTAKWFPTSTELQQGVFRDLGPLMQADAAFQEEDFYPGLLEAFQQGDGTYALPGGGELTLLFFDRDAFDAAGESYPAAGWSWDDFVQKAHLLARLEASEITRYGYVPALGAGLLEGYLANHQAPLQDTTVRPPQPLLDSPPVVEAVKWYTDLALRQRVAPALSRQEDQAQANLLIREGQAAMWTELASNWAKRSSPANVGVAPLPADGPVGTTPLVVYGYVMSAGTSQPEAAWRWLSYLSRQEPVGWTSYTVPAWRSVAESGGLWARLDETLVETYRYALEHALVQIPTASDPARQALWQAVDAILGGDMEVEAALAEAQQVLLSGSAGASSTIEVEVPPVPALTATPVETGEQAVTITFMGGVHKQEAYLKLADAFHQLHPDIKVRVRTEPAYDDYIDATKMAQASDCFRWRSEDVSTRDLPYLLSLDPFLDADPDFPQDDYYSLLWDRCRRDGSTWCLPFDSFVGVIRYREALFDSAGVDYPQDGWTLDDLLAMSVALTKGEGAGKVYGFSGYHEDAAVHWIVGLRGGGLWDTDADPPRPRFDDPEVVEAVRWYADLVRVHQVSPVIHLPVSVDNVGEWWGARELVETSKVAIWFWYPGGYTPPRVTTAAMASLPQHNGQNLPYVGLSAHFISAQTEHPEACWQWLSYLSDHLGAVQGVPARSSLAESPAFRQKVGGEVADVYLAALAQATDDVYAVECQHRWAWWPLRWFDEAYGAVLDGADAVQALGLAQYKAEEYLLCLETKPGLEEEDRIQTCVQEVDSD
jgi:ABC-type glycerol-3-phosphate transport system substrate-binding protein